MRPWQVLGIFAVLLNGVALAAFGFTGNSSLMSSVLAGAMLPVIISGGLLFWVDMKKINDVLILQKINIAGFFMKVILLGVWAAILIKANTLHNVTFIVTLLINFLAWHGVEAYYWPLFTGSDGHENGEES